MASFAVFVIAVVMETTEQITEQITGNLTGRCGCTVANQDRSKSKQAVSSRSGSKTKRMEKPIKAPASGADGEPGQSMQTIESEEALRSEFQNGMKGRCSTKKAAFDLLGGADDGSISKLEFTAFLKDELQYKDDALIERIFSLIDGDGSGEIAKKEFTSFFSDSAALVQLAELLRARDRKGGAVFDKISAQNEEISRQAWKEFLATDLGYSNDELVDRLFDGIDKDASNFITREEFRSFWGLPVDEEKRQVKRKSSMARRSSSKLVQMKKEKGAK